MAWACERESVVCPETDATQALATMNRKRARRLMVVDQDRLVGVIALGDLVNFLLRKAEMEEVWRRTHLQSGVTKDSSRLPHVFFPVLYPA